MIPVVTHAPRRDTWTFFFGVAGIVIGMYLVLVELPFHLFWPRLHVVGVTMPEAGIKPRSPFRLGIDVSNTRWGAGAAYVSFVIDKETEIEGAVTRIPGREERTVFVTVAMDTGIRNGSLILYDAMQDNRRIGERHGVHVVAGSLDIRLLDAKSPKKVVRGETMVITMSCVANESGPCEVLPLAIVYDSDGRNPAETDGKEVLVTRGPFAMRLEVATRNLAAGTHWLTMGLYDPSERDWIDRRITRREFHVVSR